ncbi:hypothetical protein APHAL10511_008426 [Amanita phalloides]|nr:hypothetical protein APHAL10511_008426 [Amanita phalloides]
MACTFKPCIRAANIRPHDPAPLIRIIMTNDVNNSVSFSKSIKFSQSSGNVFGSNNTLTSNSNNLTKNGPAVRELVAVPNINNSVAVSGDAIFSRSNNNAFGSNNISTINSNNTTYYGPVYNIGLQPTNFNNIRSAVVAGGSNGAAVSSQGNISKTYTSNDNMKNCGCIEDGNNVEVKGPGPSVQVLVAAQSINLIGNPINCSCAQYATTITRDPGADLENSLTTCRAS